ncbi:LamG domain-containing protein [Calycomorphotria hydatis]|uniref:FecR protein n=1 Tax=Calycomorphotria hydatis TaxID=2528027 RepID=A0A517T5C5_9PLAN|nr:LamG-like jellyroll fold domain-containing protein [Calycomorphotria hydatis]QDT63579.1 FecR protein [Calycomorphotria hydatis]
MPENSQCFDRERLFELANSILNDEVDTEDWQQLEAILSADPASRREYMKYRLLHAQLAMTQTALDELPIHTGEADSASLQVSPVRSILATGTNRVSAVVIGGLAVVTALTLMIWLSGEHAGKQLAPKPLEQGLTAEDQESGYDNRLLPVTTVAYLLDSSNQGGLLRHSIKPTTLSPSSGDTYLSTLSGANVCIQGPALFGLGRASEGALFQGTVRARVDNSDAKFAVETADLRIVDLGTEFQVSVIEDGTVEVHVLDGEVEIQSRVRLPLLYWNFDDTSEAPIDAVHGLKLVAGQHTESTDGIVGSGAYHFNNDRSSCLMVEGGQGNTVGSGLFAVSSGVTIEAMFISQWSGDVRDYDEIFRKEDGQHRIILCFQNDNIGFDVPDVAPGPCLSFGLHLEGLGYSELDMPLDGLEGRPELSDLTDGRPHHVAATYDSYSGHKRIFIDGQLCFEHKFPRGSLILNGGPAPASIGNISCFREPFNGVIDEVAYYDFALSLDEVRQHYENALVGENYFRTDAKQLTFARWQEVIRISEGEKERFFQTTRLPVDLPSE